MIEIHGTCTITRMEPVTLISLRMFSKLFRLFEICTHFVEGISRNGMMCRFIFTWLAVGGQTTNLVCFWTDCLWFVTVYWVSELDTYLILYGESYTSLRVFTVRVWSIREKFGYLCLGVCLIVSCERLEDLSSVAKVLKKYLNTLSVSRVYIEGKLVQYTRGSCFRHN